MDRKMRQQLKHDSQLVEANIAFDSADASALRALKRAIKPGRTVRWEHGEHIRTAVVLSFTGFNFRHAGLRVRGPSGKVYDIDAHAVISLMTP